jgi:zinc transport system ATP-binding protein
MSVTASTELVDVHQVGVDYAGDTVLSDISFSIDRGEFVGLIGQNGAGKTTLLRVILGLIKPSTGHIHWPERPAIGYVPQRGSLHESPVPMSVLEVAALGSKGNHKLAKQSLTKVDMAAQAGKRFSQLSGGQQQRVLIAKALATQPSLLILDEPTVGIDEASQSAFYQLLRKLQQQGLTIIMVSHDVDVVLNLVTRVICINRKVLYDGPPEHFHPDMYLPRDHAIRHHFLHHHGVK